MGDSKLSPAYDLLNSSVHIEDSVFALSEGLLPKALAKGKVSKQQLTFSSFLDDKTKRHYFQSYQTRLKKFLKE